MSRAVLAILVKELRELWRDPLSLTLALALPLVFLGLFTYGLNMDVQTVRLSVLDLDGSARSRDYLASLSASRDLLVVGWATESDQLAAWLDAGWVDLALIVPPDFERRLLAYEPGRVQLLVDGSEPTRAKTALAQLDAAAAHYGQRLALELIGPAALRGPAVVPEARVWLNVDLRSVNYIVPGLYSLIPMTFAPLLSTLAIVRERERGSIQQILVAPVSPAAFILGKAIPYGLLAFFDLLLVVAAGLFWFQVPFRGSMALFFAAAVIYVFCTVGVGLLVSTVTRSQVAAMVLVFVVTMMPSFNFSGFFIPIYSLPAVYQVISIAFPARYFTEISRGIVLQGAGLGQLWPSIAALTAYTFVLLLLAITRFRRRLA